MLRIRVEVRARKKWPSGARALHRRRRGLVPHGSTTVVDSDLLQLVIKIGRGQSEFLVKNLFIFYAPFFTYVLLIRVSGGKILRSR